MVAFCSLFSKAEERDPGTVITAVSGIYLASDLCGDETL